jgi:O-antigen ligase
VDLYSLRLWRDYPLFGTGAGSYYGVFPRYRQADVGRSFYNHAHDDYLELLSEYGLLGVAPLGAVVGLALWSAARAQRLRHSGLMRGMGFASLMGIIALCIHASVEFNLQIPAYAATAMVTLALAWLARYLAPGGHPNSTTGTSP